MKKIACLIILLVVNLGCSSLRQNQSVGDAEYCRETTDLPKQGQANSSDQFYRDCLDKKQQQRDKSKSFWDKAFDGMALFVIDIVS